MHSEPQEYQLESESTVTGEERVYGNYVHSDPRESQIESESTETGEERMVDKTEFQEIYQKLQDLFKGLPKEMFVNRFLLNEASCDITLENYRSVLFEELKEMADFPFGL